MVYLGPTIQSEFERFELVKQCKWVDEAIMGPWILDESKPCVSQSS